MTLIESVLQSWDRQCACLLNLCSLLNDDLLRAKPSLDGWDVAYHLCHVHEVRLFFYRMAGGPSVAGMADLFPTPFAAETPTYDLGEIVGQLKLSQTAIREFLEAAFEKPVGQLGPYETAADLHQHMVWHEGYHFGLIMLAMRLAGAEPPEEWEEANVWSNFRIE